VAREPALAGSGMILGQQRKVIAAGMIGNVLE
jgi:hypothetical protein